MHHSDANKTRQDPPVAVTSPVESGKQQWCHSHTFLGVIPYHERLGLELRDYGGRVVAQGRGVSVVGVE